MACSPRESVDDMDEAETESRARAHAANQAQAGELKREYEQLLEQQRQLKQQEEEENERKLEEFLRSDPELSKRVARAHSSADAAAALLQKQEEEKMKRRKAQEESDAAFARKLAEKLAAAHKKKAQRAAANRPFEMVTRKRKLSQSASVPRDRHNQSSFGSKKSSPADAIAETLALKKARRCREKQLIKMHRQRRSTKLHRSAEGGQKTTLRDKPRRDKKSTSASAGSPDVVDLLSSDDEATRSASRKDKNHDGARRPPVQSSSPRGTNMSSSLSLHVPVQKAVPGNTLFSFLHSQPPAR